MPSHAHPFQILQPASLAEASAMAVEAGPDAAFYAGGSELLLAMKQGALRYDALIDLKTVPGLDAVTDLGDKIEIGSLATHRTIARSELVRTVVPTLARLEGIIANPRVRATGTLGGNLSFAEPHSDPATLLLALDATVTIDGPAGRRAIDLADLVAGPYETSLGPGEILRSVVVPRPGDGLRVGYRRVQQLEHRPMLGVAVRLDLAPDGREIVAARAAVGAASPTPLRSRIAETLLMGDVDGIGERLGGAAEALANEADLLDDADGGADYKRQLIAVHLGRLVVALLAGDEPSISGRLRGRPIEATVEAWRASHHREPKPEFSVVGRSLPRTDGRAKVTGQAMFTADVALERMAYAKVLRSPFAHARLLSIDTAPARAVPGVLDVLVGSDLLGLRRHLFGHAVRDNAILAMDKVVYVGEPVVAVIAEDEAAAQRAAELVEVAYQELEPVMTPEAALAPGAPLIHEEPYEVGHAPGHVNLAGRKPGTNQLTHDVVAWGDIEAAFAKAATIVEGEYYYPMAFTYAMEPYVAIADHRGPEVTVYTSGQHTYIARRDVADLFDLPLSRVRVVTPYVGGGFGSKSYSKVEPLAAVCSWRVRRPVKVELTVEETVLTTRALDARVWLRTAADAEGKLIARQARVLMNSGAFAQNSMLVSAKTSTRLVGPYAWEAVDLQVRAAYTNTSPGSSYRGFGGAHASMAAEVQLDELAERIGVDRLEFRLRNLVERGHVFFPGKRPLHADVKSNLRLVAGGLDWPRREPLGTGKGVASIVMDSGAVPVGRSEIRVHGDGSVTVLTGSAELGQGSRTVLAMVAAEEFGLPLDRVRISQSDSGVTPYARTTGADRTTIMEGTTIQLACQDAKAQPAGDGGRGARGPARGGRARTRRRPRGRPDAGLGRDHRSILRGAGHGGQRPRPHPAGRRLGPHPAVVGEPRRRRPGRGRSRDRGVARDEPHRRGGHRARDQPGPGRWHGHRLDDAESRHRHARAAAVRRPAAGQRLDPELSRARVRRPARRDAHVRRREPGRHGPVRREGPWRRHDGDRRAGGFECAPRRARGSAPARAVHAGAGLARGPRGRRGCPERRGRWRRVGRWRRAGSRAGWHSGLVDRDRPRLMAGRPASSPATSGRTLLGIPVESILLVVSLFTVVAATNILTPLLPVIRDDFGVSIATAGWVVGSFGLARLLLDLPAGFLIDLVGHIRLTVVAVLGLVLASFAGLASSSLEMLIAARIGCGLAVAVLATVVLAALAATASVENRGKVMGLFPTANNASTAFYPIAGAIIGQTLGWRATFGMTAILAVVGGAILVPLLVRLDLPRHGRRARTEAPDPRVLHGRRRIIAIGSTGSGVVATMVHRHGFRNTVLPLYAASVLGLGGISIATAISLMSITAFAVSIPGGMLGDRIGRRRVIVAGMFLLAVGDLAFLLTGDLLSFLVVATLIGLGDFFPSSQTALLSEIVPPDLRTRVLSGYRFSVDLGAFIGPILLAGVMDATSAQTAIALAAALLIGAALLTLIGVPPSVDRTGPDEAAVVAAASEASGQG